MHIQKTQANPNFGYNEVLNTRVINKLSGAKHSKPFFNILLKLNNLTNETEIEMRKAESLKNKSQYYKLKDVFLTMKSYIATAIDCLFPNLQYSIIEAATYAQELAEKNEKDMNHWGYDIIRFLNSKPSKQLSLADIPKESKILENPDGSLCIADKEGNEIIDGLSFEDLPEEIQNMINAKANKVEAEEAEETEAVEDNTAQSIKNLVETYVPTKQAKLGFAGLGGMEELKKTLMERIVKPLRNPEQAKIDEIEYGKSMPKGILLYGPPGCGKTTIIEHLSVEAGVPLLKLKSGKYGTSQYHKTSENIEKIFDYAESIAKPEKPVLVFIDDADSTLASRTKKMDRFESEELTTFLDRIQKAGERNVITIAATNRFDMMDEAMRSRFEEQVEVPLPDLEARKSVLKLFLNSRTKGQILANDDAALTEVAKRFEKFSVRSIKMLSDKAALAALADNRRNISPQDYFKLINKNQNMKINSTLYETKNNRRSIGF